MRENEDILEIDLIRLMQALLNKIWLIILAALICGVFAFGYTKLTIAPQYQASTLMYVNSSKVSLGDKLSVSASDLSTAQRLISTYSVILKTRMTLNEVIEEAGLDMSYGQLVGKISATSVDSTEVFRITITDTDPERAALIANTIAQVLPEKIGSVVEGTSARIVDTAIVPSSPVSPNVTKNTMLGCILGCVLACGVIVVFELLDDKIQDSDYLIQTYDLPVLALIPDLISNPKNKKSYAYYSKGSEVKDDAVE